MGIYNFYLDQKVTTWYRTHFEIEAENLQEANMKAIKFNEEGNTSELPWDQYDGTTELMSVEENGGAPTEELYTDMGILVYQNGNERLVDNVK